MNSYRYWLFVGVNRALTDAQVVIPSAIGLRSKFWKDKAIKTINPSIPVIIMTTYSSVDSAVEVVKLGANDYLTKPLHFDELQMTTERSLVHQELSRENQSLKQLLSSFYAL